MSNLAEIRLVILQYAGDMRESYQLLSQSGKQLYFGHKYILENVTAIGQQIDEVIFTCCKTSSKYSEVLEPGLRAVGGNLDPHKDTRRLFDLLNEQKPTHLVLHFPSIFALRWAKRNRVKVIGLLADSFQNTSIFSRLRHARLASLLNDKTVDFVANHGLSSCLSLRRIGVRPGKIVPWDYPYETNPSDFSPKSLGIANINDRNIVYVGGMYETKGVGDILNALVTLKESDITPNLTLIGNGDLDFFRAEVQRLGLDDQVVLTGGLPNDQVLEKMRWADIVVVPSRHAYPEGLPLTIYEALTVRTPLVISNHPMFLQKFELGKDVLMFPEKDAVALARCLQTLLTDAKLYSTLSLNSADAWARLQLPVKWHDVIKQWIADTPESRQYLSQYSLGQCSYQEQQLESSPVLSTLS
ncbi:glycosyl transferase family 1 [filamentous cyanobacterium CCT1]|nr:glycosyl transferase family 1 [filamentous cyanobacterium CCT1]PSN78095.1 glycosyl transferase family 1 [filamentous cyanobacterium CCP4]